MGQQLNCGTSAKTTPNSQAIMTKQNAIALQTGLNNADGNVNGNTNVNVNTNANVKPKRASLKTQTIDPNQGKKLAQHQSVIKVTQQPFIGCQVYPQDHKLYREKLGQKLSQIIQNRYNTAKHFPHWQVLDLLQALVYSLTYFKKHMYKHHDYYPTNIFYSRGQFKINNPIMVQVSGYTRTQQRNRFSFLSPQLIQQVIKDSQERTIDTNMLHKGDIFSIGMVLLEFCTLKPSAECYDQESYTIVAEVVQERVEEVVGLYNEKLAGCLGMMLELDGERRMEVQEMALGVFLSVKEERRNLEKEGQCNGNGNGSTNANTNSNSGLSMGKVYHLPQQQMSQMTQLGPLPQQVSQMPPQMSQMQPQMSQISSILPHPLQIQSQMLQQSKHGNVPPPLVYPPPMPPSYMSNQGTPNQGIQYTQQQLPKHMMQGQIVQGYQQIPQQLFSPHGHPPVSGSFSSNPIFSQIGPNNQQLLSSTTLQSKLRLIESNNERNLPQQQQQYQQQQPPQQPQQPQQPQYQLQQLHYNREVEPNQPIQGRLSPRSYRNSQSTTTNQTTAMQGMFRNYPPPSTSNQLQVPSHIPSRPTQKSLPTQSPIPSQSQIQLQSKIQNVLVTLKDTQDKEYMTKYGGNYGQNIDNYTQGKYSYDKYGSKYGNQYKETNVYNPNNYTNPSSYTKVQTNSSSYVTSSSQQMGNDEQPLEKRVERVLNMSKNIK